MDCKAPVSIYLCLLSSYSACLLGFDTAREVRRNDMLGRETETRGREGGRRGEKEREKNEGEWGGTERGQMRGDRKGNEEGDDRRDGQLEGRRKPCRWAVGVRERSEHRGENRQ